jgi:hypothetical protein
MALKEKGSGKTELDVLTTGYVSGMSAQGPLIGAAQGTGKFIDVE